MSVKVPPRSIEKSKYILDTNTPAARETRTSEAPSDAVLLSGAALLAKELGAKIVEGK